MRELQLFRVERGLPKQIDHANDTVQGRSHFMAHVRKEAGVGSIRLFGVLKGTKEFLQKHRNVIGFPRMKAAPLISCEVLLISLG